ncbi:MULTISPECIES: glycosyltransferase [unclassified Pseudoalteromonas]|uniref:glycosyltransferase n=1 Tax=unclassified Pseudoalteromonas TaxID=194690 RepID=UPI002358CBD3|nr:MULTISPECIES: glycosyltransferase [unclassified Pseudoalteromonas]MDC9498773.1 glycosyltransferase [Pseudoalteromonas sp. Angola-20]MDC9518586.1 glycosyltransferase [Pseudoalteromonas sp. Angola-22]MDC9534993.1 glycosyltransferase [Pseudoalteromonas sp. Angola-9]
MNKNIVFFVSGLDSGGLENYLLRFLNEKCSSYNNIFVWCKGGSAGQLEEEYGKLPNVNIVKKKLSSFSLIPYVKLAYFIYKNDINVTCDFTGHFSAWVLLFSRLSGVKKRVASYRNSSNRYKESFLKNAYSNFLKIIVNNNATNIIANSDAGLDYFYTNHWKSDERFKVIRNGINPSDFIGEYKDLRREFGIPTDAFVIGHTGRFNEAKNHATIMAVAEVLLQKHQDIYFILCGNGVLKNIQHSATVEQFRNRFLLFENRNDIPCFLNTMDCFFFPSITEGQPNSLIEAMVVGLPHVVSNIPSVQETIGQSQKSYPPTDVISLANALEQLYFEKPKLNLNVRYETIRRFDYKLRFEEFHIELNGLDS